MIPTDASGSGIHRRAFLRMLAVGGTAIVARPALGMTPFAGELEPIAGDAFPYLEATIMQLRAGMQSGKWTARSLAEAYLERIDAIDRNGPALRSVIEVNPDALAIADALDAERTSKGGRGPMHGIPVLLKDNIGTADRMTTTAGSLALGGMIAPEDSAVAARLREAGALILGKTNLSEWANFRSSHSTSGWSGRGGQTKNPYALDRNPCGSSSGSAVAVSANLAAVAVGTETDGSIVCPSSVNGIVGIKPTLGLIGRSGIVPIAHSQDTAGPMARTVMDAVLLLNALAGADPYDRARRNRRKHETDYTRHLDPNGLSGKRIGVARTFFGFDEAVDALMEECLEAMRAQGAVIVDPVHTPTFRILDSSETVVLLYEFKADLNAYLASLGSRARVHSLDDVIAFNRRNAAREMPFFGQNLFEAAAKSGSLRDRKYRRALTRDIRYSQRWGIDRAMRKYRLDAITAPTSGPAWPTDYVNGDHFTGGCSTPAAVAGYPHITVPAGFVRGLPVGISFFAGAFAEPALIAIAYAFEQVTHKRNAPEFLPTIRFDK